MRADPPPFNALVWNKVKHLHFHAALFWSRIVFEYDALIRFSSSLRVPARTDYVGGGNRLIYLRCWGIYPHFVVESCHLEYPPVQYSSCLRHQIYGGV